MIRLIGIAGKKRSGKSTVAIYMHRILEKNGYEVYSDAFARALKEEVYRAVQSVYPDLSPAILEARKEDIRALFQGWGDLGRELFGKDYWIRKLFSNYAWLTGSDLGEARKILIVDDVRFKNEFESVKQLGGRVVRVARGTNGPLRKISDSGYSRELHVSEVDLDDYPDSFFDALILNPFLPDVLFGMVGEVLSVWGLAKTNQEVK